MRGKKTTNSTKSVFLKFRQWTHINLEFRRHRMLSLNRQKCENLPSSNSKKSGAHLNFATIQEKKRTKIWWTSLVFPKKLPFGLKFSTFSTSLSPPIFKWLTQLLGFYWVKSHNNIYMFWNFWITWKGSFSCRYVMPHLPTCPVLRSGCPIFWPNPGRKMGYRS